MRLYRELDGMGQRAQGLFAQRGVRMVTGAPSGLPQDIVINHLAGSLELGESTWDH